MRILVLVSLLLSATAVTGCALNATDNPDFRQADANTSNYGSAAPNSDRGDTALQQP